MKRLTSEEVRVDESVDRYLGPLADLEGMKPKLLDLILNGPVLNGVSKDVLRQIIRQLYSALAPYENTGITAEEITATASLPMFVKVASAALGTTPDHLRELVDADQRRTHGDGTVLQELRVRGGLRPDGRQKGNILPLPALDPPLRKRQHFHARAGKSRFLQLRQAKGGLTDGAGIL